MKRTMILGGHTAVICVRNARSWDVTVVEGGVDEVIHRIACATTPACLTALHFILVLYITVSRKERNVDSYY